MFLFFIVNFTIHKLLDYLTLYIQSPQGTVSVLPEWIESQWSRGGPIYGSGDYLTFSLASYLLLQLILSGDIELNLGPGPGTVKY